MTEREDLIKRLKQPQKMFRVLLVDDNADVIKKQINSKIECTVSKAPSIDYLLEQVKKLEKDDNSDFFDRYNAILFDATYKDEYGVPAISILEMLIKCNPKYANNSRAFIGSDYIQYSKEVSEKAFLGRVKKLPYTIYGESNGTKLDLMANFIQNQGRKNDIQIPTRLSQGSCREDLLKKLESLMPSISNSIKNQQQLSIDLKNFSKEFEPKTEIERQIVSSASDLSELFMHNQHILSQFSVILGNNRYMARKTIKKEKEVSINHDDNEK